MVQSLDLDLLERLWTLYDERARAAVELRRARLVKGSEGQLRPSGFYAVIGRLDAEIRQLEDRVAKSMKSRLVLGMVVKDGRPDDDDTDDMERDSGPPEPQDPAYDEGPASDPRLYRVQRDAG